MINTMEVSSEELPALDLFQNCRLCLAKEKVSVDIFSEGHEIRLLYYKIVSCLPVNVTQDDKLPRKICIQCNQKVDDFYQFWTLTARSQKTLLEWVEKRELLPAATKIKTENDVPGQVSFKQEAMDYSDDDNDLDRYDDDNSEEENNVAPAAVVKVCEEGEEGAAGAAPSTVNIKLECKVEPGIATDCLQVNLKESQCDKCNRYYKNKKQLARHKRIKHTPGNLQCAMCNRTFYQKFRLILHLTTHSSEKPHKCPICQRGFKRYHEVLKHNRIVHEGRKYKVNKAYKCKLCPKAYTSLVALEDHQYVHTGQKTHICHICSASFANKVGLEGHIKVLHEGQKRPPKYCQCDQCGKEFNQRQSYYIHMKNVHGDGKPKCHICGKVVCSKEFLATHINTHTGEKPFCCEYCGRAFASKKYLVIHTRTHTGEAPYKCTLCTKAFKQRSALTQHLKSRHPGEMIS